MAGVGACVGVCGCVCACAGGYWCRVPVGARCVAGECTLFLSAPKSSAGVCSTAGDWFCLYRSPETRAVKDGVKCPCGAWGCRRRCCQFGLGLVLLSLHGASRRGAASPTASSLGADHRLWSGMPLPPRLGFSWRESERECPQGGRTLPRDLRRAQRAPRLQTCLSAGAWGGMGKPCLRQIQSLAPAAPSPHSPACPQPCLSLCTQGNTPGDHLLSCKHLCSSPLHAAAGCLGRAAGLSVNILFSILASPCLGLPCSGDSAGGSASVVQTAGNPLNKAFTSSQLCQAPRTSGRMLRGGGGACQTGAGCSPSLGEDACTLRLICSAWEQGGCGRDTRSPIICVSGSPFLSCEMRMPHSCWGRVGADEITEWAQTLPGQAGLCRGQAARPAQAGCGSAVLISAAVPVSSDSARESVPESSRRRCNEGLKRRVGCQRGMCEMVDRRQRWA